MREFLKGLELEKETIDSIMAEYGKEVNALKSQKESLESEVTSYKEQITNFENQINELNTTIETSNETLKNYETVTNENKDLKAQLQMSNSNVKKEFSKFVTSEVMSAVNDKTDFATALENYKKNNPQYFGDTVVKKVQSSPNLNGGNTQPQTTSDIMNDILRGVKNND